MAKAAKRAQGAVQRVEKKVSWIRSGSLAGHPLLTPCGKSSDSGDVPSLPLLSNSASPVGLRVPSPSMLTTNFSSSWVPCLVSLAAPGFYSSTLSNPDRSGLTRARAPISYSCFATTLIDDLLPSEAASLSIKWVNADSSSYRLCPYDLPGSLIHAHPLIKFLLLCRDQALSQ